MTSIPIPFLLPSEAHSLNDAAIIYATLGFRTLPVYGINPDGTCQCAAALCKAPGKHPIGHGWQKRPASDAATVARERRRYPDANIGIATGPCALGYLVCIDVDKADAWDDLVATLSERVPETLESKSGRGRHLFFVAAPHHDTERLPNRAGLFGGVDVRARGGQVLASPSRHHSGAVYSWVTRCPPATLTDSLFEAIANPLRVLKGGAGGGSVVGSGAVGTVPGTDGNQAAPRTDAGAEAYVVTALENAVSDIARCSEGSRNATLNKLASVVFQYAAHLGWPESRACPPFERAGLACGLDASEVRATVASAWGYAVAHPRAVPEAAERVAMVRGSEVALDVKTSKRTGETTVKTTLANAIDILEHDARWAGCIRWNQFAEKVLLTRPPWEASGAGAVSESLWSDTDTARLQEWITREYGEEFPIATCHNAAQIVAENHGFHPVRDYLDSCTWDGVDRCEKLFAHYFGATGNPEYLAAVSVRWLISAVARIYDPGCKVDTLPILEGDQGLRKSSALQALAGEWFSDTPLKIGDKDAFEQLKGRWIIELAELDSLSKSDASAIKAFISSREDTYRAAYARRAAVVPRSSVFAGSVNPEGGYLKDATGNRRFWPVACGEIDLEGLKKDRDQLWAEAKVRHKSGQRWWIDTVELESLAKEAQEDRYQEDEWEGSIRAWLHGRVGPHTTDGIMSAVFGVDKKDIHRGTQMRVSSIMKRLGYSSGRHFVHGSQRRAWAKED